MWYEVTVTRTYQRAEEIQANSKKEVEAAIASWWPIDNTEWSQREEVDVVEIDMEEDS